MQAEHAGTRTYYFGAESHQEQEEWIQVMSGAAQFNPQRKTSENAAPAPEANHTMVTKAPDTHTQQHPPTQTHGHSNEADSDQPPQPEVNGVDTAETPSPSTPIAPNAPNANQEVRMSEERRSGGERGGGGGGAERDRVGPGPASSHAPHPNQQPNGWGPYGPPHDGPLPPPHHGGNPPPPRAHSNGRPPPGHPDGGGGGPPPRGARDQREVRDQAPPTPENVVLMRGFVPRTAPERLAQRKSSMTQLQQWVNQRRVIPPQEDMNSPSRYYTVNRGVSADFYSVYPGGPQYVDEYPLYPPGVRPDSICSVSAVGGYDRRRSLRDGPPSHYGPPMPRDPWGPPQQYYGGPTAADVAQNSMRRLSIQPRSRSVPRSPSSSSGGPYSPGPHSFVSPARSPSTRFDRLPGRMREDVIYADPSIYGMRRSISSPKYDYPGDRRSLSQGLYHYPASPSIHSKMVPPFHDVYSRELHPTLKLNEIETSKILGRLCEQNRIVKDQEAVVHRLRMDKDSLEGALVATHQEMEMYHNQPLAMDKLQLKKETLQNQLINIRGELSQASSALTTSRMEFEALEDEANAIHGDLWEQLNAGGQSELVHRHIQKEFWRVQDVLEGLHKSNSSRGTDTAKHRVVGGPQGSFSTNSPASPLSSVSLTSPLSPYSPMPATQPSPTKQLGPEVSTGRIQQGFDPNTTSLEPCACTLADFSTSAESRRRPSPRPRPKSWLGSSFEPEPKTDVKLRPKPKSNVMSYTSETKDNQTFPVDPRTPFSWPANTFQQALRDSLLKLEPVEEEEDHYPNPTLSPTFELYFNPVQTRAAGQTSRPPVSSHDSKLSNHNSHTNQTHAVGQALRQTTSSALRQQAMIGYRKDVYPDPHPPPGPAGHQDGRRYLFHSRRSSVPKAQHLLFQDASSEASLLSFNDFPKLNIPTLESTHIRAATTEYHHQSPLQARSRVCARIRPLSYPNGQFGGNDYMVPRSVSPCMTSGGILMQTHL